jgi:hypothetical protein
LPAAWPASAAAAAILPAGQLARVQPPPRTDPDTNQREREREAEAEYRRMSLFAQPNAAGANRTAAAATGLEFKAGAFPPGKQNKFRHVDVNNRRLPPADGTPSPPSPFPSRVGLLC